MTNIRPKDLPAVTTVTAGDSIMLDGATLRSITNENLLAPLVRLAGGQQMTGGVTVASHADGTVASGTFVPDATLGNMQYLTANGAFILGVPTAECSMCIEVTNGSSAGAITTSAYGKTSGDSYTTTNGSRFFFHIIKSKNTSRLYVEALQ